MFVNNKVAPMPTPSKLELNKGVDQPTFNKKLDDIADRGQISRAEFKDLAKSVSGGKASLATFLKTNNIVPAADVDKLSKFFHFGYDSSLKSSITSSSAIKKFVKDNIMERLEPQKEALRTTPLDPKPEKLDPSVDGAKHIVNKDDKVVALKKKEVDLKSKIGVLEDALSGMTKGTPEYSAQTKEIGKLKEELKKIPNEIYSARLDKQVEELNVRKTDLVLRIGVLTRGLQNTEVGSPERKEQNSQLFALKQELKSVDDKLSKIPDFKKAGVTSESVKGYQASKSGENLYQKVLGTKIHEMGPDGKPKVTTMLNSDNLGIMPAVKPKLKGYMEPAEAHGHDDHAKFGWANVKDKKVGSPAEMTDLISYRKAFVDQLMKQVKEEFQVEGNMRAVGSTNLTSDYDATILGLTSTKKGEEGTPVSPEVQAKVVARFNELFRKEFGVEAGTAFDTNIYVDDFDLSDRNKVNPTLRPQNQKEDDDNQDSLALVKQRIHMGMEDDTKWNTYVKGVVDALPPEKRPEAQAKYDQANKYAKGRELEINTEIVAINRPDIDVKKLKPAQIKELADGIKHAAGPKGEDIEAQALNRLYEKKLVIVKVEEDAGSKLPKGSDEREKSDVKVKKLKGEALFFANEPYFSEGGVRHIVGNLQKLAKAPLDDKFQITKSQAIQSVSENIGDTMKEFNHFSKDGLGTVAYKASKYVNRLADAITIGVGVAQGEGAAKKMVIPPDINITLNGKSYPLKDIVADMEKSNKALLEIRGEKVGKDWTPVQKR
jgi:hypothetical protein